MDVQEVEEPQEPGEEQEVENEELEVSQIMYNLQVNQTMFGFTIKVGEIYTDYVVCLNALKIPHCLQQNYRWVYHATMY